ncbi:MAG: hypothetical protein WAV76_09875 [Bacteroidota bacterium]
MLTRILVVQPLFSVVIDETGPANDGPVCGDARPVGEQAGEQVGLSAQFWALLGDLVEKAAADVPLVLTEISALIAAFRASDTGGEKAGEKAGANGAILNALTALLEKAAAVLPTILPEILQLISLFGGTVNVTPAPAPTV